MLAPPASAIEGCEAPPGTAVVDQYCETLPTAEGPTDATGRRARPLVAVLPKWLVKRLREAGLLGEVLLSMPAGVDGTSVGQDTAAMRRAAADPRLEALLPGEGADVGSVMKEASDVTRQVEQGFAWTLCLTLAGLASMSAWGSLRKGTFR